MSALTGRQFYRYISAERFDLLDVDALVVLAYDAAARKLLDDMPTYRRLRVVREGRAIVIDRLDLAMALAASTVTSLPYALDDLVPPLARAIAKV